MNKPRSFYYPSQFKWKSKPFTNLELMLQINGKVIRQARENIEDPILHFLRSTNIEETIEEQLDEWWV